MIKIMLVEDNVAYLRRLCEIIEQHKEFHLLAALSNGMAAIDALVTMRPDVLLVDLGLPDINGLSVIEYAASLYTSVDIMVLTIYEDQQMVLRCIESGATGYLLKDSTDQEIAAAIHKLYGGGSPISPLIARSLLQRFYPPKLVKQRATDQQAKLSPRQAEILALLAKGLSYGEIAYLLEISPHTVTTTVKKLYQKLAVHSRGEAVYEASRMGLINH